MLKRNDKEAVIESLSMELNQLINTEIRLNLPGHYFTRHHGAMFIVPWNVMIFPQDKAPIDSIRTSLKSKVQDEPRSQPGNT